MKTNTENRILFKNPEHQAFFDANGYVVVDFLNNKETASLKKLYDSLEGDLGEAAFASTIMSKSAIYRHAVSKGIENHFKRAMATIFEGVTFFWGNFNIKYPHQNIGIVPLHQDPSFLDERRFQPLGLWVPLMESSFFTFSQMWRSSFSFFYVSRGTFKRIWCFIAYESRTNLYRKPGTVSCFTNQ
jgi:hypothetical protein